MKTKIGRQCDKPIDTEKPVDMLDRRVDRRKVITENEHIKRCYRDIHATSAVYWCR